MVYTAGGRYQAVNLFPGNYEVSVSKKGFASDVKKVVVRAGEQATVNFALREAAAEPMRPGNLQQAARTVEELVPYDVLYPREPGREVAEKTCIFCHGVNFVPTHQWNESQWNAAVDLMSDPRHPEGAQIPPGTLSPADRRNLVSYLTRNFGPTSRKRGLELTVEMPLDEQTLAKAMYVEYDLPVNANARPRTHDPHFDHDGNVFYTNAGENGIGKLDPRTGTFRHYPIPTPKAGPEGLTADAQGHIWWSGELAMGRLDPKTGEMVEYPLGKKGDIQIEAHTPAMDSKQNVWFTALHGDKLGKWDRKTEKIIMWDAPTPSPYGIAVDKKDRVWFAEYRFCKIGMFDPATEKFTEYSPLVTPCQPRRVGVDSKGTAWYAVHNSGMLGKIDPESGKIVEYKIPVPYSTPYDAWPDREDNIWVSDGGQGGALIKFDPRTEKFLYYPSPRRTDMPKIEITRDGAIWYCTRSADIQAVGVLYPDMNKITTLGAYY